MSRLDRFGRLEGTRGTAAPAGGPGPTAPPPSLEGRFGAAPVPAAAPAETAPADGKASPPPAEDRTRSGGQPARFEEPGIEPSLRVLDLGDGQPFVRCARCRGDSHATAVRCAHCEADLRTREQRAFNEQFWKRRLEEKAEQDLALDRLRAARAQADRDMAEAFRHKAVLDEDLARRRALGLPLDLEDGSSNLLLAGARRAGGAIGRWLRRAFPDRAGRIAFLVSSAALLALVLAIFPAARWILYASIFVALFLAFVSLEVHGGRR